MSRAIKESQSRSHCHHSKEPQTPAPHFPLAKALHTISYLVIVGVRLQVSNHTLHTSSAPLPPGLGSSGVAVLYRLSGVVQFQPGNTLQIQRCHTFACTRCNPDHSLLCHCCRSRNKVCFRRLKVKICL